MARAKRTSPTMQNSEVDYEGMDPAMAATLKRSGVRGAGETRKPAGNSFKRVKAGGSSTARVTKKKFNIKQNRG